MALPSAGITARSHPRPRSAGVALLVAATVLAACSSRSGGDERAGTSTTEATSTTLPEARCPDGSALPDGSPVADVPPLDVEDRGPDGRDGALDVATLMPRTGDLAFLGPAALAGVELAVADLEEAGGILQAPIGVRHGDSAEGTPDRAEAEVARLLAGGADVVIGPLASGTAARVLEQVSSGDAVLVTPGSTSTGLDALDRSGRLFRTGPTEALQGAALAELVYDDGHRTVSVAARQDDYGRAVTDALAARLAERGATVAARADYDPTTEDLGPDVVGRLDTSADAIVLVGLAETARILDALVDEGQGPTERAVYGTDGNLGERLGDLVAERSDLACMRGVLPTGTPDAAFARRVRARAPALAELDEAGLDLAAESYDATVVAALAAASAGSDGAGAIAAALPVVTDGATPCGAPDDCLELLADGVDVAYAGPSGPLALDADGNRSQARLTVVAFDDEGHLARVGTRPAGR